jgi:hypothetical protein
VSALAQISPAPTRCIIQQHRGAALGVTIVPRRYLSRASSWRRARHANAGDPCASRQIQACHLIERKGQLAHQNDERNREEIDAVIHCRVTQNSKKAYAEAKPVTYCDDSLT